MIGGGMSHRGMFRRKGGFRYLHDEISGGVSAYSHLKTKSAYSGNSMNIYLGNTYGFTNNQVDISAIQSDYPSNKAMIWYDQIGGVLAEGISGWDGSNFLKNAGITSGYASRKFSDAKTFVLVYTIKSVPVSTAEGYFYCFNSNYYQTMAQVANGRIYLRKQGSTRFQTEYDIPKTVGTKLVIWQDDGSLSGTSQELYYQDMTYNQPKYATSGTADDITVNAMRLNDYPTSNGIVDGYLQEFHQFDGVLTESQRIAIKEIFEQRYTFS